MAVKQEREMLKKAYPNKKWAEKVDKMTSAQVAAMILRLKQQNKL
jgi:hypothetical protein